MERPVSCPECGYDEFHRIWQRGRKLAYRCEDCHWLSEHFTPELQEIETERKVSVGHFCGIEYTVYDQYGHRMIGSRTYDEREIAIEAMQGDLIRNPGSTAVLWPEYVMVKGEVFK